MAANAADYFIKVRQNFSTVIGAGGVADGTTTTIPLGSVSNLPTDTAIELVINRVTTAGAVKNNSETVRGVISGSNLTNVVRGVEGTAQGWDAGVVVEYLVTADIQNRIVTGLLVEHGQDGIHSTATFVKVAGEQTISGGKTFSQSAIFGQSAIFQSGIYSGDTLLQNKTETLTNKTLTSPVINGAGGTGAGILGFNAANKALLVGDGSVNEPIQLGPWIAYTPTTANITLGNGTLDFAYANIGKTVVVRGRLAFGSGTSISGVPTFSLPYAFSAGNNRQLLVCRIVDSGTGEFVGCVEFSGTADVIIKVLNCASTYGVMTDVSSTVPMTWATNDYLQFVAVYEASA